jgi:hypothetical protein
MSLKRAKTSLRRGWRRNKLYRGLRNVKQAS